MAVGIVGSGPAVAAIEAALEDVDVETQRRQALDPGADELGIVVDVAGATTFERANDTALEAETPWIAVELGGVGGVPVVDAAITGFRSDSACYECLGTRVRANVDPSEQPTRAQPPATARYAGAIAGRAVASVLDPGTDGPDPFGTVIEVPHARRRVLAVPHCACGTEPDRTIGRERVDREVDESLGRAERGLDERVGLVREVGEVSSYPLPYYLAQSADTSGFSDASAANQAAGVALDWNASLMKGFGEVYERYAAGVYRQANFQEGTPADVATPVPPSSFVGPSQPAKEATWSWIDGENLATSQTVQLPASLAVYPPPNERIRPATTTGLGFGNDAIEAMLAGLYEVIERDAAMLSWYSTFEPLGLSVEDDSFQTLIGRLEAEGLSVTTLLLTQDVDVPVVACAVHRAEQWPRFALGSSAQLDPTEAARSALSEATQNWLELSRMGPEQAASAGGAIGEYASFPERVKQFIDAPSTVPATDVGVPDPPVGQAELEAVVERITKAGMTPYATRLTPRDIDELGFEATRVLVPKAQPLFLGEPYFGDRLESVPPELGFEPRPDNAFHPFP
ncbi:bacteriocin biosynthesis protein SagD [Halorhabdus sp. CBA1104]|uniref:YcaO-like family protein n=1 Tax=Halorhabdus sp. CBA1104 TaxID=1380432 RepID=UPI0012B3E008|nr:YcaO-like family protein [Halorhabdus sp. CBA1104]QGN06677.1 bacteriocin biosynthesis protein SagD [Halorhabdus sp. CBA1104]